MTAGLAYINDVAEKQVAALEAAAGTEIKYIAGFPVEVPSDRANRRAVNYRAAADILKRDLAAREIEPIAILPASWWDKMVHEAGLIDFDATRGNQCAVSFRDKHIRGARRSLANARVISVSAGLVIGAAAGAWFGSSVLTTLGFGSLGGFVGVAAGAVVASTRFVHLRAVRKYFQKNYDEIIRDSIEVRVDTSYFNFDQKTYFSLPTPPADFAETLKKLTDENGKMMTGVRVAAEPTAFSFERDIGDMFVSKVDSEIRAEAERRAEERRRAAADPIIYYRNDAAVAIIGQFGDFPIEKELIDQVVGMGL